MRLTRLVLAVVIAIPFIGKAQPTFHRNWSKDGNGYYFVKDGNIALQQLYPAMQTQTIIDGAALTPKDSSHALNVEQFVVSEDENQILLYTNSKKVWRYNTKGDYWLYNKSSHKLQKLGASLPASSLMFAKISPDGSKVAYVSLHNLYVEDVATGAITALTKDGTARLINGTFDWAYEEEFGARDGFRWSPDSKSIAFWQLDANKIRNFKMINNTDSIYSFVIPVEYPVVGQTPSPAKVGIVSIANGDIKWMNVPGDPAENYIPRMEWANNQSIVLQQLNRKQNQSTLYYADIHSGKASPFYEESDKAWIDIKSRWNDDDPMGWDWLSDHKSFLWVTEKDGWRHIYRVNADGKKETLLTKGNYDILSIAAIDEKDGFVYFMASPENATQQYLYRVALNGKGALEKVTSDKSALYNELYRPGTHDIELSPNGQFAKHSYSNANYFPMSDWLDLKNNKQLEVLRQGQDIPAAAPHVEFTKITTPEGVTMDAWVSKPLHFDSTKKYPVVFYVYTEPASATVKDSWGSGRNFLYPSMPADGYVYVSVDSRGTPAPKGAAWRKSIYKQIGILNIHDQAEAAKQVLKWNFIDTSRVAVWGWSGGGSTTLNLMFQHPEIYKTGIAVAPVANQLTYDNIYEERYMGLPQEDEQPYIQGSPISHAQGLQGHLLLIHGTGDDNVHYQNSEMLINKLIEYNKVFQFMPYPNRTHAIREGVGTTTHLSHMYTDYMRQYCPPGAK